MGKGSFKYAWVWGTSVKHQPQKVGKEHKLDDEDVVRTVAGASGAETRAGLGEPLARATERPAQATRLERRLTHRRARTRTHASRTAQPLGHARGQTVRSARCLRS